MDFDDFELDPEDLAFALGISEEMADEEKERLRHQKEFERENGKLKDDDLP